MAEYLKLVTAHQQEKFQLINVSIKDPKKISLSYSVNKQVKQLQHNFRKFDIGATFNIVFPNLDHDNLATKDLDKLKASGEPESKDLFKECLHVTPKQVADSCRYFNLYTLKVSQLASHRQQPFAVLF